MMKQYTSRNIGQGHTGHSGGSDYTEVIVYNQDGFKVAQFFGPFAKVNALNFQAMKNQE